ncbi:zinc ribbon domain-containing protein [Jeotgalibaca dankookensis]|uniref:zinc ribbon domain-containing protein n=1 Tax=Jeotgalibaca dankookensis TaxID=708126 RepID=UPI000785E8FB|nr:zinc ribbon domain-containing protein [Jeotgalibaca dankookensis]
MSKLVSWVQNIMRQANGFDDLSRFLLKTGAIIGIIGMLFRVNLFLWLGFILILFMYIRTFSKDRQKYYQQNRFYHKQRNKIINFFNGQKNLVSKKQDQFKQRKTYRFYKCPNCGQKVRVPKGKGKIAITCPACSEKFVKKS